MRIERHDGALDKRALRKREIFRFRLETVTDQVWRRVGRLHHHDVADSQRVAQIGQRWRTDTVLAPRRIGPEGKLEGNSRLALGSQYLRLASAHLGNKRCEMIVQHLGLMLCKNLFDITGPGETADRATPTLASVERLEAAFERHSRSALQRRVQRRAHRQPAGVKHVLAKSCHDGTPDFLGEIGCVGAVEPGLVGDR